MERPALEDFHRLNSLVEVWEFEAILREDENMKSLVSKIKKEVFRMGMQRFFMLENKMSPYSESREWLDRLNDLLDNLIRNRLSFNFPFIAREMAASERGFYRKLKKATGKTPSQYLNSYRIKYALSLIDTGKYTDISSVMKHVGIGTRSYFRKIFIDETGMDPSDLLK